jgi:hypothetical protein
LVGFDARPSKIIMSAKESFKKGISIMWKFGGRIGQRLSKKKKIIKKL